MKGGELRMNIREMSRPIIIAGPCAAESKRQVIETAQEALKRDLEIVRLSLHKPRTEPGFDGVKGRGIPWLIEVAQMGITPATEVMNSKQADKVVNAIVGKTKSDVMIWIGSRNQNHIEQQEISRVVAGERRAMLMVKNQPWAEKRHWEGIIKHVLHGGASKDQILLCHRGFHPGGLSGPDELRNIPDFKMAMEIKRETGLPMVIDPSHIGGSVENVLKVTKQAAQYRENGTGFDGMIIEVHPTPQDAKSDAKQQLTWDQLDTLLREIR